jgi:hypothetical protein
MMFGIAIKACVILNNMINLVLRRRSAKVGQPRVSIIEVDYILHNHILEPVTSAKYLGVTLQSNLKWNTHIDNITSNGNKSLGYLQIVVSCSCPDMLFLYK